MLAEVRDTSINGIYQLPQHDLSTAYQLRTDPVLIGLQDLVDQHRHGRASGEIPVQAELEARSQQLVHSLDRVFPGNIYTTAWPYHDPDERGIPKFHVQMARGEDAIEHHFSVTETTPDQLTIFFKNLQLTGKLDTVAVLFRFAFQLSDKDREVLMDQAVRGNLDDDRADDILRLSIRENGRFEALRVPAEFA